MPVPDFSPGEVLTAAAMDSIGLWEIEVKDVVNAGTIDFTNVFSTNYTGYLLTWQYVQNTSQADLQFQFRDSGGAVASGYRWGYGGNYVSGGTPTFAGFSFQVTDATQCYIGSGANVGARASGHLIMPSPTGSTICYGHGQAASINYTGTLTNVYLTGGIVHNTTTNRTGIRLFPGAGTVTGKFSLYGYRN